MGDGRGRARRAVAKPPPPAGGQEDRRQHHAMENIARADALVCHASFADSGVARRRAVFTNRVHLRTVRQRPSAEAAACVVQRPWRTTDERKDDGRMTDDIMALDERLTRLEMTVATGFSEIGTRIGQLETGLRDEIRAFEDGLRAEMGAIESGLRDEIGSVEGRLRVLIEAGRDEQRMTAEGYGATLERIDARLEQMHEEHLQAQGDHARALQDHERRITVLERRRRNPRSGS